MKKSKLKTLLIVLIILIVAIAFGAGTYAGYVLSAKDVTYTKSDGTTISVKEALDELRESITTGNLSNNFLEAPPEPPQNYVEISSVSNVTESSTTSHTANKIYATWEGMSKIAQAISNNASITNDTAEVEVTYNGGIISKLGVGDTITLDGNTVRILGFNHDKLASSTAYGAATATGKAGISFEYVTCLTYINMNSSDTNSGGWGSCSMRTWLNETTYSGLSIKDKIKRVKKEYIQTYNSASSKTTSSDYLWLLSCGEIWDNGYDGGVTRGYAIATEGSQYKYYKSTLGSTAYNSSTDYTKKPSTSSSSDWWLRSPWYYSDDSFCYVCYTGSCRGNGKSYSYGKGVAPSFCI